MRKLSALLIIIFLMVGSVRVLMAARPAAEKTVFPNGLTLIHQQTKNNEVIAMDLFIKGGSVNEDNAQAGLANFVQSMLYKGTNTRSAAEISVAIESLGASITGSCEQDYALVSAVVFKKYFPELSELFFESLLQPSFPVTEIEKTRANLLASIKTRADGIFNVSIDLLNEQMYGEHPYHKPAIGYQKSVASLSRKQLMDFYYRYFRPENMTLVVVGNISKSDILGTLKQYFPNLNRTMPVKPDISAAPGIPDRFQTQEISRETKFEQGYLMLGYLVPSVSSEDYAVLKIISSLLGGGMNSRLFLNLREKEGLAYELDSFYPSRVYNSEFIVYLGLQDANIPKAYALIRQELNKLRKEPVGATELQNIQTYLSGQFLLSRQTNQELAFYLGFFEMLKKGYEYDSQYLDDLNRVTASDILRVANTYFNDNNLTVIKLVPSKNQESGGGND